MRAQQSLLFERMLLPLLLLLLLEVVVSFVQGYQQHIGSISSSYIVSKRLVGTTNIININNNNNNNNRIYMQSSSSLPMTKSGKKGKLLILGGTGFLGQTICKRATLEGYSVTSLSRRGRPLPDKSSSSSSTTTSTFGNNVEYITGDAREKEIISNILKDGGYVGK